MDEQRLAAYLELIQALLECPNGEEGDILNAHRELVDADFVQVVEAVAENMAAEGNSNAGWLQNLAAQLANSVRSTATPEEYLSFLGEVLQATGESRGNPQVVYPILQQNLDKLDLKFAQTLQNWATSKFTEGSSKKALSIAADIVNFGNLIQLLQSWATSKFTEGSSKKALSIAADIVNFGNLIQLLQSWATSKFTEGSSKKALSIAADIVNFGNLINQFPLGRRAWNLEIGIACYREALIVYTPENYPKDWAMTQNNLGNAYQNRIEGVRAANIEEAIACYRSFKSPYPRELSRRLGNDST
ncbi:hypothetical protein CP500_012275 [Tychonema bourrellyi FEM_GT703]|uniref:Tetratricopeptide repeat protein n=1 Tax=Tychonema bourrellyi FEM_GT703 TaxID=2040638 RepID=A0A2G4F060_9CYAN|nr:tetratricopeptide repeat protein [Tychonema bourrellyi]PHX55152.1 hypothetical protein CP500_012275 [Tychonema bourrellyi FEM_GT703]